MCPLRYPSWPWLTSHMSLDDVNKLILTNGKSPCEGHLQIYHKGEWRYVGDKNWNRNTEEVVCRSTNCGKPVSSEEILRPIGSKVWLNHLNCKGNESHLWDCENPGWGKSNFRKDTMRRVKCSSKAWLSVNKKNSMHCYNAWLQKSSQHKITQ